MALADEIAKAKQLQQIANWDAAEKRIADQLGLPKAAPLGNEHLACLDSFGKWAAAKGVRKCPCKPHVLAAFALENNLLGVPPQQTLAILKAVEEQHHNFNLSNPAATKVVWAAVEKIGKAAEPPRSWTKAEKAEWLLLPPDIRQAISRREAERDRALRQAQNKLADLRHALAAESALSGKEETTMSASRKGSDEGWKKGAIGIDGREGENFSRQYRTDPWDSNPAGNYKSPKGAGKYQDENANFLRNKMPDEATARSKDIFDNVNRNSDLDGKDATGPVKYGVD